MIIPRNAAGVVQTNKLGGMSSIIAHVMTTERGGRMSAGCGSRVDFKILKLQESSLT